MALISKLRRVLMAAPESTSRGSGTPALTAAGDAIPLVRSATWTPKPIRLDRPTLRLTMTGMPDTFPGVATVEIVATIELSGLPANPQATYATPSWVDLMRMCGFEEVSNQGSPASPGGSPVVRNMRVMRNISNPLTGTAPAGTGIRHGVAAVAGTGNGVIVGDFYDPDDFLYVEETTGTVTGTTWTQTNSDGTRIATFGTRETNIVVGLRLQSDINKSETGVVNLWTDGKLVKAKGVMGNFEIQLNHGDMIVCQFTLSGVLVSPTTSGYSDQTAAAMGTPNELHKVPPTFLGKDLRLSYFDVGGPANRIYGKDTGASYLLGALNKVTLNSGNQVILRENSLDPNGVSFALITGRKPTGTVNPDEVLNGSPDNFDFMSRFVSGAPLRMKAMIGTCFSGTTPAASDGNTIDIIAPGCVIESLGDGDRDQIQAWDGAFKCTGGDYDPTAAGETPGSDNELTIIYR